MRFVIAWLAATTVYVFWTLLGIDFPGEAIPGVIFDGTMAAVFCVMRAFYYVRHENESRQT
jgi:hypothetical protein